MVNILVVQWEDGEIVGVFSSKSNIIKCLSEQSNLTSQQMGELLENDVVTLVTGKKLEINEFTIDSGDCFIDQDIEDEELILEDLEEEYWNELENEDIAPWEM